jgi:hypothetical protein
MRRLFFPGLILALSAPALVLRAQDFQHEGPKAVPPQAPPAAASNAPLARPVDDNQVLVPRLQALVSP